MDKLSEQLYSRPTPVELMGQREQARKMEAALEAAKKLARSIHGHEGKCVECTENLNRFYNALGEIQ